MSRSLIQTHVTSPDPTKGQDHHIPPILCIHVPALGVHQANYWQNGGLIGSNIVEVFHFLFYFSLPTSFLLSFLLCLYYIFFFSYINVYYVHRNHSSGNVHD